MNNQLKLLAALSVLLNLLLAGVVLGHVGRYFMQEPPPIKDMAAELPEAQRQHFRDTVHEVENIKGDLHEQVSDMRKKMALILKKEPFDKAAYMTEVEHIATLRVDTTKRVGEYIAQRAQQAAPEERAMLAELVSHPPEFMPKH